MRVQAVLVKLRGEWQIFVRRGTLPARRSYLVGHELAHWWLRYVGLDTALSGAEIERHCDRLGAALALPRRALLKALQAGGRESAVTELAQRLRTTQSLVLLRLAECVETPTALVEPRRVIIRGAHWGWPAAGELRRMVLRPEPGPGLRRVVITDEPKHTGLVVA
jgi:hypothetical protein